MAGSGYRAKRVFTRTEYKLRASAQRITTKARVITTSSNWRESKRAIWTCGETKSPYYLLWNVISVTRRDIQQSSYHWDRTRAALETNSPRFPRRRVPHRECSASARIYRRLLRLFRTCVCQLDTRVTLDFEASVRIHTHTHGRDGAIIAAGIDCIIPREVM